MKAFDKCIDQLLDAVTRDMIHVDNLADDIGKALRMKITREKRKKLEAVRNETLDEFRTQVKKSIEDKLKPKLEVSLGFGSNFQVIFRNLINFVLAARVL